ncbi:hypothetical protein DS831_09195 [Bombilactobacillus bombi]|uniref:Uncharacterized protein n=1 Tax=Bombilactobacillus bombi TaxID=1303590 RepID=A0A417ZDK9_9LACO|nr:pectate lyase-like adhesive domain-containing protein [Bombilactobacillus bombi]RHW49217.1 hypothetical protein DS831_09195 [Bombilactobacillus bombi]
MKIQTFLKFFLLEIIIFESWLFSMNVVQATTNNNKMFINKSITTPTSLLQTPSQSTYLPSNLPPASTMVADDDNPYSNAKQDLMLYYNPQGGYTAVVYTPNGFLDAIYDPAAKGWGWDSNKWKDNISRMSLGSGTSQSGGGPLSEIHKIILANDINMDDIDASNNPYGITLPLGGSQGTGIVNGASNYRYVHVRHNKLDIDGNQHYINMMNLNIALCGTRNRSPEAKDVSYKEDWTLENTTIYSTTYWGYLSANTGLASNYEDPELKESGLNGGYTWFTYKNMNFVGSQFAWTGQKTTGVSIEGNVNVNTCYSYIVPNDNHIWRAQGGGNQQNFEVDRVIFKSGCHYTGYSFNGVNMELTGKATFEDDSIVDLYPHGTGPEHQAQGMSFGIYMPSSGNQNSVIEMNGDSKLNIHCDSTDYNPIPNGTVPNVPRAAVENHPQYQYPCGAIDMESSKAQLVFNKVKDKPSPQINIDSHGQIFSNKALVYFSSGDAELANGTFNMKAYDLGNYDTSSGSNGGGLMNVGSGMIINVRTGGIFNLEVADNNHSANHPLNLLYAQGKIHVNIVNPTNVSLDLRKDPCDASALVYARGNSTVTTLSRDVSLGGKLTIPRGTNVVLPKSILNTAYPDSSSDIEVYDTKIRAEGNNQAAKGNGQEIVGPTGQSEDVKLGMGTGVDGPIRVQRVELPFTQNLIDPLLFVDNTKVIQARNADGLKPLKLAMFKMLGKEFRYISLSDLPGPSLILNKDSNIVYPSKETSSWKINGQSGGDEWADYDTNYAHDSNYPEFQPTPPLVRVQVKRLNPNPDPKNPQSKYLYIDLGTMANNQEAEQKANSNYTNPAIAELTNPITPNILNDNFGNLSLYAKDDKGNQIPNPNLGQAIPKYQDSTSATIAADFENKHPKYLDPKDVQWDGGSWDPALGGLGSSMKFAHRVTFDLHKLIDNYNASHKQPLYLKATDQILTSTVTNFQSSPLSTIYVRNLSMATQAPKEFLLGEDIQVPISYYDGDENFNSSIIPTLTLTGKIDATTDVTGSIKPINLKKKTDYHWNIGKAVAAGQHKIAFTAQDNSTPINHAYDENKTTTSEQGDVFNWQYNVLNLPAYAGQRQVQQYRPKSNKDITITHDDATNTDRIKDKMPMGRYLEKNTFTPKDQTAPISNFMFVRNNERDKGVNTSKDYNLYRNNSTLVITEIGTNNKLEIKNFNYNMKYTADSYKNSAVVENGHFKKNIKFEITTNLSISNVPNANLSPITLESDLNSQQQNVKLATIAPVAIGDVYLLQLIVPNIIDYGDKHVAFEGTNNEYAIVNQTAVRDNLILNYLPIKGQNLHVYVKHVNGLWDSALQFKGNKTQNLTDSDLEIFSSGPIDANLNDPIQHIKLADNWWNQSNQQQAGLFMKTQSHQRIGNYVGELEWTVTDSI